MNLEKSFCSSSRAVNFTNFSNDWFTAILFFARKEAVLISFFYQFSVLFVFVSSSVFSSFLQLK